MISTHPFKPFSSALLVLIAATLAAVRPLCADELIMRDGSQLHGEVVKRTDGTLEFNTAYAGIIKVKWAQITEIRTDKPMEFLLTDERSMRVTRVTNNAEDMIVERGSGLPAQTLAQDVVADINPEPWQKGTGYKLGGRVNFAFERQRGNTDDDELDMDGDLLWRRKKDRFTVFGELEYDKTNNRKTKDKWTLESVYNYFFRKQWYWGGFSRFEHDEFADLDLRTSVGPIIGYQWFESKALNLRTATGLTYVNEEFISESNDHYTALPWAIDYDQFLFGEFVQIYHKQIGFWNLTDTSDVVWDTWTGLRFPLVYGLVASTEMKVEYDSGAAADADNLDTTYYLKMGYEW